MPARSTALICTNTSREPSVGWMNPKPFCVLKNFTVPVAIVVSLLAYLKQLRSPERIADSNIRVLGDDLRHPKAGVARQTENWLQADIYRTIAWEVNADFRDLPSSALIGAIAGQWIVAALVETLDVVTVETLVADLHPGAERADRGKILDCESDRLRGGGEAAITERLARTALAFGHEQFGRCAVVEFHRLACDSIPQQPSGRAVELAFLDEPLVRLVGAFDAVLAVVAFGRQELRDLVGATAPAAPAIRTGRKVDGLADLEFVFAQDVLRGDDKGSPSAVMAEPRTSAWGIHDECYHGNGGPVSDL